LILLCGLPASGKTTLAKRLAEELPAVRLCPDEWLLGLGADLHAPEPRARLERLFGRHALDLARLGLTVVLEFGFWTRAERDELRLWARAHGTAVELRHLTAPVDELWRRLEIRNREGVVVITREMIDEWSALIEVPTDDELALFDPPPGP
jgi:predicted kinase